MFDPYQEIGKGFLFGFFKKTLYPWINWGSWILFGLEWYYIMFIKPNKMWKTGSDRLQEDDGESF